MEFTTDPVGDGDGKAEQEASPMSAEVKQRRIREIMNDSSKTPIERNEEVQRLMTNGASAAAAGRGSAGSLPCPHYEKKCSDFYFECCGVVDNCRRCHLDNSGCQSKPPLISRITW
jgi:hypothetical protein